MNSKGSRLGRLYSQFLNVQPMVAEYGLRDSLKLYVDRIYQRSRDRRLGIRTIGYYDHAALGLAREYNEYEAVNYRCLDVAFRSLQPICERDVAIDYGAGMGRVMVKAARYPFGKVLGVESAPRLIAAARRNLSTARSLRRQTVELLVADALEYELPTEVNRIILFNPMIGRPMYRLLDRIHASLLRRPRPLKIVYLQSWAGGNALDEQPWLRKTAEPPLPECAYTYDKMN